MQGKRILIIGLGKIGWRIAESLATENEVFGLRYSSSNGPLGVQVIQADIAANLDSTELPSNLDLVLYCLSPATIDDEGYQKAFVDGVKNALNMLENTSPACHFFFVSSTSVYGQDDDSIIDENSITEPARFSGRRLLEGEASINQSKLTSTIVRFTGIYGGNRTRMLDMVKNGKTAISTKSAYTNRIHEDDCVGFILHLMSMREEGKPLSSLYLATDSLPIRRNDFLNSIAEMLEIHLQKDGVPQKDRAGSKQCSNSRMLSTGYTLKYPTFREGYRHMIDFPES